MTPCTCTPARKAVTTAHSPTCPTHQAPHPTLGWGRLTPQATPPSTPYPCLPCQEGDHAQCMGLHLRCHCTHITCAPRR